MSTAARAHAGHLHDCVDDLQADHPAHHQHDAACHHLDAPRPVTGLVGLARAADDATDDVSGGRDAAPDVRSAITRRAGRGEALPGAVALDLGGRMGTDFSGVRVHADAESDTIARSVQAKAFTLGSDIYFSKGAYAPGTRSGQTLLAHELTHVRQHAEGSGGSGGALKVGRADDPAEREAEQVARTIDRGGSVAPSCRTVANGGAVTRSTTADGLGTIRRLFGFGGVTAVAQIREKELKSDDEGVPAEFLDLAGAVKTLQGDAVNELGYGGGSAGLVSGGKDVFEGGRSIHKGRMHLKDKDDSVVRNLGAHEVQEGTEGLVGGLTGLNSGAGSFVSAAAEEIPGIDIVSNFTQAAIKTKKVGEDSATAHKLGNAKTRIKRDQDQYLPDGVRAKRFGEFVAALRKGSGYKRDDAKRWDGTHAAWVMYATRTGLDATLYDLAKPADGGAKALKGAAAPVSGTGLFNPLTADWTSGTVTPEQKTFLNWLRDSSIKDFGYGTDVRDEYEKGLKTGKDRTGKGGDEYEGLRDVGKVASFGRRRKAETATVGAVEVAGHVLDGAGTMTAAGDLGATKVTGKALKAGAAAYKGIKSLAKRARRVHKLKTAKNEMGYGGEDKKRGFGWGVKQFFGGNLASSMDKAKTAANEASVSATPSFTGKSAKALDPGRLEALTKRLTLQCQRRIDALLRCLVSDKTPVRNQAKQVIHLIAETNMAGALSKIEDADLNWLFDHKATTVPAERATYEKRMNALQQMLSNHLKGIGG